MQRQVTAPVLQLHGTLDTCVLPSTVEGSQRWASGGYRAALLPGVGHFPHQEAPETVTAAVLRMRARDRLGRPVPTGDPAAVPDVPEQALPPEQALALAQELLDEGRAFGAHEVLEASWKAAPRAERDLWQGLAQLCVGITHLQRGNAVGAARLLTRAAGRLPAAPPHGIDPGLAQWATRLAAEVEGGRREVAVPVLAPGSD